MARCMGAKDFVGAAEDFVGGGGGEEKTEELAVRASKMLAVRALLRCLAVRALKQMHWACVQASLA